MQKEMRHQCTENGSDMNFTTIMKPFHFLWKKNILSTKTQSHHPVEDIIFVCFWLIWLIAISVYWLFYTVYVKYMYLIL